jgi:hypothetical protein
MGKVLVGLSISLDGFIAGPNDGPGNGLGDGGDRLFEWLFGGPEFVGPQDFIKPVTGSRHHTVGAPFFVLTHSMPDHSVGPGTEGTAVTDGIESALEQAQAVAGERVVAVGPADVAQQYLNAGLIDELHLNLVPCLLGGGVRLFDNLERQVDLDCFRVIESEGVTHLAYRVAG